MKYFKLNNQMTIENANTIRRASKVFTADPLLSLTINTPTKCENHTLNFVPDWIAKKLAKISNKIFVLKPVSVGNMYRMAVNGSNIGLVNKLPKIGDSSYNKSVDILSHTAALLLSNSEDMPSDELITFIEENFTFAQIQSIAMAAVIDTGVNDIYKYYGLLENAGITAAHKDSDYLQHKSIGQMLVYFKGAFTELEIKWRLTWNNYLLYLASIGIPENGSDTSAAGGSQYKSMEIADWS